ncbi:Uridine diphosphate glucose pyrophosphatase [Gryllus bimaculatus]|nr:Uridine diphosphate glucose pyrophosphatase [Gryllus bimaculatus]
MDDVHSIKIEPLGESIYVKPFHMTYIQNGVKKFWDFNVVHDSVSVLLFNVSRKVFVFVRQFRPAVFFNSIPEKEKYLVEATNTKLPLPPIEQGITLELCAGVVDKEKSLEEIAREEVLEECGYDVPVKHLERILSYRDSIGIAGDKQTIFYAEITDDMRVSKGGGKPEEGELIEVVEMSETEVKKYLESGDVLSPGGFAFALYWFFENKKNIYSCHCS